MTDLDQCADKGANGGVVGGVVGSPFVVMEALDKRCRLADWAHGVVFSAEQRDRLHAVTFLLVPVHHQYEVGVA